MAWSRAVANLSPVSNDTHTLAVSDVGYGADMTVTPEDEKRAILERKSLTRPLKGTWTLSDNVTGQMLEQKRTTVAKVPYMLDSGTFLKKGNKLILRNQSRLRPGVFARRKENGEIEAHVNAKPNEGPIHRYFLDQEKGTFYLKLSHAKIPLIPLLRAAGTTDREMQDAWGNDVFKANKPLETPANLEKIYKRFARGKEKADVATKYQQIREKLEGISLDPVVSQQTLGYEAKNLNKQVILQATAKLLKLSRNEIDPDERDNIAFQTFHGPEDILSERITNDYGRLRQNLLWAASRTGTLKKIGPGTLDPQLEAAVNSSGLAQDLEDVSGADAFDKSFMITRLGEGALPCHDDRTEVMTDAGWKLWSKVTMQDALACQVQGELQFHIPEQLQCHDYEGDMYLYEGENLNYKVTPSHRLQVRKYTTTTGNKSVITDWVMQTAEETGQKRVHHQTGGVVYKGCQTPKVWVIPPAPVQGQNRGSAATEDVVCTLYMVG